MRNEKPVDADWVLKQHRFAKGKYGEALRFSAEVEKLWKADFDEMVMIKDNHIAVEQSLLTLIEKTKKKYKKWFW